MGITAKSCREDSGRSLRAALGWEQGAHYYVTLALMLLTLAGSGVSLSQHRHAPEGIQMAADLNPRVEGAVQFQGSFVPFPFV